MRANLVRIGNSRGIRIPKKLLEQCHLEREVELEVRRDHLAVLPAARARAGWDEAFRSMAESGDDALLQRGIETSWDRTEWKW